MADDRAQLHVAESAEALARDAADFLCSAATAAEARFTVCLAGGSTPKRLYELLSGPDYAGPFPWARAHWFLGDERFVPHDDRESNYRMVRETLLARAPVPQENVHPVPTEGLTPEAAAAAYEQELKRHYGSATLERERPLFDVTLLGLGEDGHTASLFPGHAALEERQRWALAVAGAKPEVRITLTYSVLESSREVVFMVAGAGKRERLAEVRRGGALPAARLKPVGRLHWFADRAAAPEGA